MATTGRIRGEAVTRWNTPTMLKVARTTLLVLDGLLLAAILIGIHLHRAAMQTVGKDAAPSIIAAQHIKSALADMDADAVNELLSPARSRSNAAYEDRRVEAARALVTAAENITYGDSERGPIQTLEVGMGTYEDDVQQMRDLRLSGDAGAVAAYGRAAALMDQTLLPAADALDAANNSVLERSYVEQSRKSAVARVVVVLLGLVAFLGLGGIQILLSQRTRRTFNPALLAAALVTLVFTAYSVTRLANEQRELKIAKQDGFDSIRALWRARALAYEANSEESRYLADPANALQHQQAFFAISAAIAKLPAEMSRQQVESALAGGKDVEGFSGYLAKELENVTFAGEREAALRTLTTFEDYMTIDSTIRQLEASGRHPQAVALCTGISAGESDWAFARFDEALGATLAINQTAFAGAVDRGFAALDRQEIKATGVALLLAVLIVYGFAPRIREYE